MSDQPGATRQGLDHDAARALFERNYQLLNEHDARHIPTIFTEDIEFRDDAWPETIHGHAAMERFLTALWRAAPDFRFELVEGPYLDAAGRHAAVRVRVDGTMTGPFEPPGFAPTHRRLTTEYGGFFEFEGDRVRRGRVIVNMHDAGIQMGAAPPHGSRAEKMAVTMQHLNARRMARRGKG